jgi:hypothetical protein
VEEIAKYIKDKNGGDRQNVSAFGSAEGNKLYPDATSSGTVARYRLALTASSNSASGEYRAFSTDGVTWIGLKEGVRIASDLSLYSRL